MFVNFGKSEEKYCLGLLSKVRSRGIPSEIYPEPVKLRKQMSYANNKAIPFVALVGESEIKENKITVKRFKQMIVLRIAGKVLKIGYCNKKPVLERNGFYAFLC